MSFHEKSFLINGRSIRFEELVNKSISPATDFEKEVFDFCIDWLKNSQYFSFSSSGSTGNPSEIIISKNQIIASIERTANALQLTNKDKGLVCLPIAGTGGKMMIARCLYLNMFMECTEPSGNPFRYLSTSPTFTALTPYQLETIINEDSSKLNQLKVVIVGGADVSTGLKEKVNKNLQIPVFSTYGMTETVSHIALKLLNTKEADPYFTVLPGIEIKTDENENLQIKGDVTNHQWITTTDRVKLINKKKFEWVGRSDRVINSGGVKIHPENIEKELQSIFKDLNIQRRFFIHGMPHDRLGTQCALFIEGMDLNEEEFDHLKKEIRNTFDKHHRPKEIHFIPEFCLTASGKIDKINTANLIY